MELERLNTRIPKSPYFKDISGRTFGRITVLEFSGRDPRRNLYWKCQCQCGKTLIMGGNNLTSGASTSCGCLKSELLFKRNLQHGAAKKRTPEYLVWKSMRQRCLNPNNPAYDYYGGRGITVCKRWNKFENFLSDMGERPKGLTLERKKVNGNYEPSNCVWDTSKVQGNNKRNNRLLTLNGRTQTIPYWSEEVGISQKALWGRILLGWSDERVLTTPLRSCG